MGRARETGRLPIGEARARSATGKPDPASPRGPTLPRRALGRARRTRRSDNMEYLVGADGVCIRSFGNMTLTATLPSRALT